MIGIKALVAAGVSIVINSVYEKFRLRLYKRRLNNFEKEFYKPSKSFKKRVRNAYFDKSMAQSFYETFDLLTERDFCKLAAYIELVIPGSRINLHKMVKLKILEGL